MLFHTVTFFIFFLIFIGGLSFFQGRARILYVTLASYLFYGWWYPPYVLLLFGLTAFAYFAALLPRLPRWNFVLLCLLALIPLCFFKYTVFFLTNLEALLGADWAVPSGWQLPLGISFISFTVIAYLVDVRNGEMAAEKSFMRMALYISFFPQLIAGPIMRPRELLPQLKHLFFKRKMLKLGALLFAVGLVKKVVFADQIAAWVDRIYAMETVDWPHAVLAFYGFPVQIYCDFSGYTDMALGLAFVLGVRLPLNFNRPYAAASIREFWRRWHITLSRWLRDYLYIPLGGSRHGFARTLTALMVTMVLGGLWHGAAWTFVVWGALHGFFLVLEHCQKKWRLPFPVLPRFARIVITFHLVGIAWVLFRAGSWNEVVLLFSGFGVAGDWQPLWEQASYAITLIGVCLTLHFWDRVSYMCLLVKKLPGSFIYTVSLILILVSKILAVGNPNAFIYFDF